MLGKYIHVVANKLKNISLKCKKKTFIQLKLEFIA